jgi:hypothetical protein
MFNNAKKDESPTSDDLCVRELRDNRGAQGSPGPPDMRIHHEPPVHRQSHGLHGPRQSRRPLVRRQNTEAPAHQSHGLHD